MTHVVDIRWTPTTTSRLLDISFASALEEEANNEDLEPSHGDHHEAFDDAEVPYPLLGAADSAKITVFACPEVLLVASYCRELRGELDDGFFEDGGLFRG